MKLQTSFEAKEIVFGSMLQSTSSTQKCIFLKSSLLPPQAGFSESVEQHRAAWEVVCLRQESQHGGQTV